MKKPYFNQEQRALIYNDTFSGSILMMDLAVKKLLRDTYKESGWIAMKKMERKLTRYFNLKLLGRDAKRKWWQIF